MEREKGTAMEEKKRYLIELSASQEDVVSLWKPVMLVPEKNQKVKVISKRSDPPTSDAQKKTICGLVTLQPQDSRKLGKSSKQNLYKNQFDPCDIRPAICSYNLREKADCAQENVNPDDEHNDDITYCRQCNKHFFGVCHLHFALVLNRQIRRDGRVSERARETAPWPLYICASKVEGAGEGVWTCASLPPGLVFGPYEGILLRCTTRAHESGYAWHVRNGPKSKLLVDSEDKTTSNWLRYVNCARSLPEMNLEAFQYRGNIYYVTLCHVDSGSELMVWYGEEYGKELGISNFFGGKTLRPSVAGKFQSDEAPINRNVSSDVGISDPKKDQALKSLKCSVPPLKKNKDQDNIVKLSKPQSELQHLFIPAILETGKDQTAKVANVKLVGKAGKCGIVNGTTAEENVSARARLWPKRCYSYKYNRTYCVECRRNYEGFCLKHPMTLILDSPVPRDGSVEDRARLTAPWPIYIAQSKIPDAGEGVWTDAFLPQGLVFGPCEGYIKRKTKETSGYAWDILGKPKIEVDAKDTSVSNWVRYINCARNNTERNLMAMQVQNEIFYVTCCDIERDTELMVWYGDSFGEFLGISVSDFNKPLDKEQDLEQRCCDCQTLFPSEKHLLDHQPNCNVDSNGKRRVITRVITSQSKNKVPKENKKRATVRKPRSKSREKHTKISSRTTTESRKKFTVPGKHSTETNRTTTENEMQYLYDLCMQKRAIVKLFKLNASTDDSYVLEKSRDYCDTSDNLLGSVTYFSEPSNSYSVSANRSSDRGISVDISLDHNVSFTTTQTSDHNASISRSSDNGACTERASDNGACTEKASDNGPCTERASDNSLSTNRSFDNGLSDNRSSDHEIFAKKSSDHGISANRPSDHGIFSDLNVNLDNSFHKYSPTELFDENDRSSKLFTLDDSPNSFFNNEESRGRSSNNDSLKKSSIYGTSSRYLHDLDNGDSPVNSSDVHTPPRVSDQDDSLFVITPTLNRASTPCNWSDTDDSSVKLFSLSSSPDRTSDLSNSSFNSCGSSSSSYFSPSRSCTDSTTYYSVISNSSCSSCYSTNPCGCVSCSPNNSHDRGANVSSTLSSTNFKSACQAGPSGNENITSTKYEVRSETICSKKNEGIYNKKECNATLKPTKRQKLSRCGQYSVVDNASKENKHCRCCEPENISTGKCSVDCNECSVKENWRENHSTNENCFKERIFESFLCRTNETSCEAQHMVGDVSNNPPQQYSLNNIGSLLFQERSCARTYPYVR